jgi:hypothetical protein
MHFQVVGADSVTGKERTAAVQASDEIDAARRAREQGIFVYKVVPDHDADVAERVRANSEAHEQQMRERTRLKKLALQQRVTAGRRCFMYKTVFVPVDSRILDQHIGSRFEAALFADLGLDGWEVVGVVPRTLGVGLSNDNLSMVGGVFPVRTTTAWGGGVGGNVDGVYVILMREILADDFTNEEWDEVARYIRAHLEPQ